TKCPIKPHSSPASAATVASSKSPYRQAPSVKHSFRRTPLGAGALVDRALRFIVNQSHGSGTSVYRQRLFRKEPLLVAVGIGIRPDYSPKIVDRKGNRRSASWKFEQNKCRLNLG